MFAGTKGIVLVTLAGFLPAAAGAALLLRRKLKLTGLTMLVTARVTDVLKEERTEWEEDRDGRKRSLTRIVYTPILEYEIDGKAYRKPFTAGESAERVNEGETLKVYCNPDNPSEACCRNDVIGLTLPISAIVMGGGIALIGIVKFFG